MNCVLVSEHLTSSSRKWLINISLKRYFKASRLFHSPEEKAVEKMVRGKRRGPQPQTGLFINRLGQDGLNVAA